MKKTLILLCIFFISGCTYFQEVQEEVVTYEPSETKTEIEVMSEYIYEEGEYRGYMGAYFFVKPPEDFILQDNYTNDYAAFESPDGKVVFAVYSPLWHGKGEEIWANEDIESETEREVKESIAEISEIGPDANRIDTYATTVAHDKSFWRSLHEIIFEKEGSSTQRVFSYQYADKDAYDKYLQDYLDFKNSLEQYAD